ncbi:MAG TPA: hypothetical protein VL972_05975 [Solirubrobacteraceae bacterium]|nr:hypothetical protein [Solirubrobacteraceae bacterium]
MALCGGLISPRSLLCLLALGCSPPATALAAEGAPGGATAATSTRLVSEDAYRGALTPAARQSWYRLEVSPGEKTRFSLRGQTSACPVQASLVGSSGAVLGQILSTTRETLAFVVFAPTHATADTYYLRLALPSGSACPTSAYLLRQFEPLQSVCEPPPNLPPGVSYGCDTPKGETRYGPLPIISSACRGDGRALRQATAATKRERRRLAGRRDARAILQRLEQSERLLNQRTMHACGGP